MKELVIEIFSSMRNNKLRTVLTGFSVAWGIFMLVILLGSGNGLKNGSLRSFLEEGSNNVIIVKANWTTMPYKGLPRLRRLSLGEEEISILENEFDEITNVVLSSELSNASELIYNELYSDIETLAVGGDYHLVCQNKMIAGRFINERDESLNRKVVVVDKSTAEYLFKGESSVSESSVRESSVSESRVGESAIGKLVSISGVYFTVIGVVDEKIWASQGKCYMPLSTGSLIFNRGDKYQSVNAIGLVNDVVTDEQLWALKSRVRKRLSTVLCYDPDDKNAIRIENRLEDYRDTLMVFKGVSIFIWLIGLGTLAAGIVGVSNIMIVTVRERTFEFGVRKALGAKPSSIIRLILLESVAITSAFGYVGMFLGVFVMELVNVFLLKQQSDGGAMFVDPTLDIRITISATIVLVLAGLVAGYIPARRASRCKTVDALRYSK